MYLVACLAVFLVAYILNTTYITVFYHRGWAHGAVDIKPWATKLVSATGNWVTGLDPKGWVCMHRLHHAHSDTDEDPHSPKRYGILGVLTAQLRSYERALVALHRRDERYSAMVRDLDFPVSWLNRKRVWYLPYVLHVGVVLGLGLGFGFWLMGACYFMGMMSHPIQGWLVNSFGHAMGGRNFETADNSRNNLLVGWLVQGEGFQNNHHRYPSSAKFGFRWYELDLGYYMCWTLEKLGAVRIRREKLIPSPAELSVREETVASAAE